MKNFSRKELVGLRLAAREAGEVRCPRCTVPMEATRVPPRGDVAYVRDRTWLLCPSCRRSAVVDRREMPGSPEDQHGLPSSRLATIGWREWLTIPGLGVEGVKAKIDTGARTSSLHVENAEEFRREGLDWVRFTLLPLQKSREGRVEATLPVLDRRSVRSSSGEASHRLVVRLELALGPHRFPCEVTLARRDQMGFRMLLGRTALRGRFLVDPGRSYLQSASPTSPK